MNISTVKKFYFIAVLSIFLVCVYRINDDLGKTDSKPFFFISQETFFQGKQSKQGMKMMIGRLY